MSEKEIRMKLPFSLLILIFVLKCVLTHGYKARIVVKMGTNSHVKAIITSITSGFVVNGMAANALDIDRKVVNNMVIRTSLTCSLTPLFTLLTRN